MTLRENFRDATHSLEENKADKKILKSIKTYFKYVHSFSYRALTMQNEFFSKLPVEYQNEVKLISIISLSSYFSSQFQRSLLSLVGFTHSLTSSMISVSKKKSPQD